MRFDYQVVNSDFNYLNKDSRVVDLGQHLGQAIFSDAEALGAAASQT
jgi:hypothetical protein